MAVAVAVAMAALSLPVRAGGTAATVTAATCVAGGRSVLAVNGVNEVSVGVAWVGVWVAVRVVARVAAPATASGCEGHHQANAPTCSASTRAVSAATVTGVRLLEWVGGAAAAGCPGRVGASTIPLFAPASPFALFSPSTRWAGLGPGPLGGRLVVCVSMGSLMKLASYRDGSRDGQLVVVSRDLGSAHYATGAAHTLQQALDDWNFVAPQLQDLSLALNRGRARHAFPFDPAMCLAPLPRAHQCARGTAYASHRDRLRESGVLTDLAAVPAAHRVSGPNGLVADAALGPAGAGAVRASAADWCALPGDALLGAHEPLVLTDEALGLDFEAGLAAITGDVPQGSPPARALEGIRLLMLAVNWCLRTPQAKAWAQGLGAAHTHPGQGFGPVAVTPDELGEAWHQGRLALTLHTQWNGRRFGLSDTAAHMTLHWGQLVSQLAAQRAVRAGTVVLTGPVSAPLPGAVAGAVPGAEAPPPHAHELPAGGGVHCIAERRALEVLAHGQATTGYARWGDEVRVELKGRDGLSPLGALQQQVVEPGQA